MKHVILVLALTLAWPVLAQSTKDATASSASGSVQSGEVQVAKSDKGVTETGLAGTAAGEVPTMVCLCDFAIQISQQQ